MAVTTINSPSPSSKSAMLVLAVLCLIWGYSWVIMKVGLKYAGPFDFAALRGLLSTLILFMVLVVMRKPLRPQELRGTILLGNLQNLGPLILSSFSLANGGAGKTAVLVYTMPFWTLLVAWPALGEKIRGLQWLAVLLGFFGTLLVLEPWNLHSSLLSNALAVLSGMIWAGGVIMAKKMFARSDLDLVSLTAWQMFFGAIPAVFIALLVPSPPIEWSSSLILAVLYAAIPGTAIAWFLWLYVVNRLPAGTASLNALAVPAIALLLSWLVLDEKPGTSELLGILAIFSALAVISLSMKYPQSRVQGINGAKGVSPPEDFIKEG